MTSLQGDAATRVRAMSLWLICAVVVTGVLVLAYSSLVGFDRVGPAAVEAVAPTGEDGRDLLVRYTGGEPGCADPHHIDVEESRDAVVISAYTVAPNGTREGLRCSDVGVPMFQTVRMSRPLGERSVEDGSRPGVHVVVHPGPAELLAGDR